MEPVKSPSRILSLKRDYGPFNMTFEKPKGDLKAVFGFI